MDNMGLLEMVHINRMGQSLNEANNNCDQVLYFHVVIGMEFIIIAFFKRMEDYDDSETRSV